MPQENKQTYKVNNPSTCKIIIEMALRSEPSMIDMNNKNKTAKNLSKKLRKCHMKHKMMIKIIISSMNI